MPDTKHALIRYKILDNCFRNPGRKYFLEDLMREVDTVLQEINPEKKGISRRQLLYDIEFMESCDGWAVELNKIREGHKVFYRYADMSFSINNMPLNEVEINQLKDAVSILSQFKGMPQFEWVYELIPKLQQGMESNSTQPSVISFDSNEYLKGVEYVGVLYSAITYKQVLKLEYHPFDLQAPIEVEFHPYYLKQYNNRWFVLGLNMQQNKIWTLALDRVVSVEELTRAKYVKTDENWDEFFDDIVGVTIPENGKVEEVVLLFFGLSGKYIETKPLHGSQKSKWLSPDCLEVRLNLIINYEFEQLVLSYGENVKVISPTHMVSRITNRVMELIKIYTQKNASK
ncbi:MAG: WYL domain-containing protein [Bacteroidetes bacterium GWF2_43_63]|nr:MAG: WYL domain-containing protein [Bacteroidetes bacterium GWE2_42_42]OFY52856.1 MAG: WYL domain-containing protein [Bacteroidetes bacterium GWF2_43_63]HBG70062.1 WYL domain-containing protein [Bacteroidales bacterium]HCB62332.1 WYL domain-containing protein [Bacteroidales bacterium]